MLPYFLFSNASDIVPQASKQFLQLADCCQNTPLLLNSNGFQIAMLPSADNHVFEAENETVIVCGFIRHPQFIWDWKGDNTPFFKQLITHLAHHDAETIKAAYTGSYTLIYFANNRVQIFNTLSGLQPVYYHCKNDLVTVCSSLVCMHSITHQPIRQAGALQLALNEWMETYTRATVLANVYRTVCNEWLTIGSNGGLEKRIIPFKVDYKPEIMPVMDCVKKVWQSYKDIGRQFAGKNLETCMSLSGGVDSRTCLTAIHPHASKIVAINHGAENFYEFKCAKKVAKAFGIEIVLAPSAGAMFPPKQRLDKYFMHDGGVVIEYDPIKEAALLNNLPPMLVLGDLFETFKVDGTSVWEGRAKKKSTTLKLMFGGKLHFETIENYGFEKWVDEKADYFMKKLERNAFLLTPEMTQQFDNPEIKKEIKNDFIAWLSDFKYYGLKYVEDLNEVAYWLSKGRTSMWLQSSSSSGSSVGFTLFCTDQNLAEILSVPIKHKLRQKLHFYMFKLPEFKAIKKIPTPQIPFTNVSAPLPIKELVMYLRLKLDTMIGKRAAKLECPQKIKLLKGPNYKKEYNTANLQTMLAWYNNACISKAAIKVYFEKMQHGDIPSVSTIDYIGLAKAEYIISKCRGVQKEA